MHTKRWLLMAFSFTLAILVCMAAIVYFVDPFYMYRYTDSPYVNDARFCTPGLIRSYDYDTAIIGSSVTQNFDMQEFRDKLGVQPLKCTTGGMNMNEQETVIRMLNESGKCKRMYICIDLYTYIATRNDVTVHYPAYLCDDNPFNDYRYLLGYETWMRFLPTDAASTAADALQLSIPETLQYRTNVDTLETWDYHFTFGKDVMQAQYVPQSYMAAPQDQSATLAACRARMDTFLADFPFEEDVEYIFFFPPYSAVYWWGSMQNTSFDELMQVRSYFVQRLCAIENVTVYDFQPCEYITDMDYYMDQMHYSAEINSRMVDCFANGTYRVTTDTVDENNEKIADLTEQFITDNADWLMPEGSGVTRAVNP